MPHGDAHLHAVAITQRAGGCRDIHEIAEDDDPLLLDAEGGNLGKRGRLDPADAALERVFPAPLADFYQVAA